MYPKSPENRCKPSCDLINQFKKKGYTCTQKIENDKTTLTFIYANGQRFDSLSLHSRQNSKPIKNN